MPYERFNFCCESPDLRHEVGQQCYFLQYFAPLVLTYTEIFCYFRKNNIMWAIGTK